MSSAYTYTALITVCLLIAGCNSGHPRVQLQNQPGNSAVDVPLEIHAVSLGDYSTPVRLTPVGAEDQSAVLQPAPALLEAPDTVRSPSSTAYCGLLPAGLSADEYEIRQDAAGQPAFSMTEESGRLTLREGDQPVFAYNYGTQLPDGINEEFARSSYIHPIWGLDGMELTDDFPEDHLHHRGLSWMWPRVFVGGEEYDVWALRGMEQVFDTWLLREVGPACATIGVKNHWEVMEDGRNVVDEWVWVRAFPAGQHGRAIDVRITLEAHEPLEIAGRETDNKGYGGLSLRFAPREETQITSNEGREAEDSDHRRLPWADESGRFGTDTYGGMAIFQHSTHPDFPAQWTLRHYGFLGVAWPGNERRTLQPGEPITLRYRVWIHRGDAEEGRTADAYAAFANPSAVRTSD